MCIRDSFDTAANLNFKVNTVNVGSVGFSSGPDLFATANGGNIFLRAVSTLNGAKTWQFYNNGNLIAPGNISTAGNITGGYILGNGSQLTGLPATYGNSNVVTLLSAYGSNTVSTTGNISAGNVITSGALQGGTGTQGIALRPWTGGGSYAALYSTAITPADGNYIILVNGTNTWLNAATGGSLFFRINNNSTPTASVSYTHLTLPTNREV